MPYYDLKVGPYRDNLSRPKAFDSTWMADQQMQEKYIKGNGYYRITDYDFLWAAKACAFGIEYLKLGRGFGYSASNLLNLNDFDPWTIASVQVGTRNDGYRVLAEYLKGRKTLGVLKSEVDFDNEHKVLESQGLCTTLFRYYDKHTLQIDFEGMISDLKRAPYSSVVLFQTFA